MDKNELRRALRQKRRNLTQAQTAPWNAALYQKVIRLPVYQQAQSVFLYVSVAGEPDTHAIIRHALAAGKKVYVPRCLEGRRMETVPIRALEDLEKGYYGLLEPKMALAGEDRFFDLMVLPALACSLEGKRLGQGGGYYDRFLAVHGEPHLALCYEAFLLPDLPDEAHDVPMKMIVTEDRVLAYE